MSVIVRGPCALACIACALGHRQTTENHDLRDRHGPRCGTCGHYGCDNKVTV